MTGMTFRCLANAQQLGMMAMETVTADHAMTRSSVARGQVLRRGGGDPPSFSIAMTDPL